MQSSNAMDLNDRFGRERGGAQATRAEAQTRAAWITLVAFALVWSTHLALTSRVVPFDNIEQLNWAHVLHWGYYKHPPLPTWLMGLAVRLTGYSAWTSSVLGAVCTLASIACLWRFVARLRGEAHAAVALLAVLCVTYYNGRLNYYNHNIVLMLLSTLAAVLTWQAYRHRSLGWWAALGLVLGAAFLSKYQAVVTVACLLVFLASRRAWRDAAHRRGLLLTALVALAVFAPHLVWLFNNGFPPIDYAMATSLGAHLPWSERAWGVLKWLADQLLNRALPAWLMLGGLVWFYRRRQAASSAVAKEVPAASDDDGRALLLAWGFVPLVFIAVVGALEGAELQTQWGTAFVLFAVPATMEWWARGVWRHVPWRRALQVFVGLQFVLLLANTLTSPTPLAIWPDHHWRSFDARALAQAVGAPARQELGAPIAIVAGEGPTAGALALELRERPLVLIDGDFRHSPWLTPELVQRCGMLEILRVEAMRADAFVLDAPFDGLAWRVTRRQPGALPCPIPARR